MPFDDNSFEAAYSIEATVHAPDLKDVYSEVFRVLKPGGMFGVYEWVMTSDYDDANPRHREIRLGLEKGGGIVQRINTLSDATIAIKAAGFELLKDEDLAERPASVPWYWMFSGDMKYAQTLGHFVTIVRLSSWGLKAAHNLFGFLESLGVIPVGTKKTADSLALTAECLAASGRERLFTPIYMMIARKPTGKGTFAGSN